MTRQEVEIKKLEARLINKQMLFSTIPILSVIQLDKKLRAELAQAEKDIGLLIDAYFAALEAMVDE